MLGAERVAREAANTGTWRGPSGIEVQIRWDPALGRWFKRSDLLTIGGWSDWRSVGQEWLQGYVRALERGRFEADPGVATAEVRRKLGNLP